MQTPVQTFAIGDLIIHEPPRRRVSAGGHGYAIVTDVIESGTRVEIDYHSRFRPVWASTRHVRHAEWPADE